MDKALVGKVGMGVVLALALLSAPARAEIVGQVKDARGPVTAGRDGADIALLAGDDIHLNDDLRTGSGATLGVSLNDGTRLSLGPNGRLTVDRFLYDPGAEKMGLGLTFLNGTLQYISGRIAKVSPQDVTVDTPTGTIGIRGTRFLLKVSGE